VSRVDSRTPGSRSASNSRQREISGGRRSRRKATFSANNSTCVETGWADGMVGYRDTKHAALPVRIRRSDALAFDGGRQRAHGGMATRPVPLEVRRVIQVAGLPQTGAGEFHVSVRNSMGHRVSSMDPFGYVDTTAGRYATLISTADGETELLLAPTSHHDLVARLNQAHYPLTE
jgi:hypothetical protein